MFKKKNFISKLWLKYHDRNQYKQYKWELQNYNLNQLNNFFTGKERLDTVEKIIKAAKTDQYLNILHGGNAGDIIYALPTIKRIYEFTKVPVNLYLRINQPLILSGYMSHPLGKVRLNEEIVDSLLPLIMAQQYIHLCEPYNDQKIHIDLDFFRSKIISLTYGNIARWCSYVTGVTPELWKKWIFVEPDLGYKQTIVLSRSERYRNPSINYSFLQNYPDTVFIGIKSEYKDMKRFIPQLEWIQVKDFLELANIIAGCKLFIGNQSFPYSIAEGLKVPRILEVYHYTANVIPEGKNAHDFYFQNHLESLVKQLTQ